MTEKTTKTDTKTDSKADSKTDSGSTVSGCVKPRINGEQRSPLAVILGAGGDSERRVGV